MKRRTMIACGIIALLFVLLIGRLIYFSIFKNGIYKRQVLSQQNYSSETLPYKRGDILDRDGNTLATSQKMYTLVLEPKNILRSEEVQKATIDALHKYMKLDEDKLLKFIKRHNKNTIKTCDISKFNGNCFLGIDAGTTTTKVALNDEDGNLCFS